MTLTRESILSIGDLVREEVFIPEWQGSVFVRTMTGRERDSFEQVFIDNSGSNGKPRLDNIRARLAVLCSCDEMGDRLFSDDDVEPLASKSAAALNRIFEVAQRLNGMRREDVEELSKNSGPTPGGDSHFA